MNHVKWAAWGVVDIEAMDRQQRRNYLKKVHAELRTHGITLHVGGSKKQPYYRITRGDTTAYISATPDNKAFPGVCREALVWTEEVTDVSGEDGGVRRAGDEVGTATDAGVGQ